jgi:Polysaccharide deacetylase
MAIDKDKGPGGVDASYGRRTTVNKFDTTKNYDNSSFIRSDGVIVDAQGNLIKSYTNSIPKKAHGGNVFSSPNGRSISDYQVLTGTGAMDTSVFRSGDRTLRVNLSTGADVNILHSTTPVVDIKGRVGVWMYVPDVTKMSACILKVSLGDDTYTNGAFQTYSFSDGDKNFNGWHFVGFTASQFGGAYGTPDWAGTPVVAIRLTLSASAATQVYIDDYRIGWSQIARLLISDDDGYSTWFTHGLPILESFGIRANMGIISALVGSNSTWVTEAQLKSAYNYGHDLCPHGLTALSEITTNTGRIADVKANKSYLVEKGFTRGLQTYIWPNGVYQLSAGDQTLINILKDQGFVCARGTTTQKSHKSAVGKSDGRWLLPILGADSTNTVSQIKTQIDNIVATGETGFLMFHSIALSNATGIDVLKSVIWEISAYIHELQCKGTLEVITASELAQDYI